MSVVVTTDDRGVAVVTLNRPDKHNALTSAMITKMTAIADALAADAGVRAVVLAGAGPSFCAGGDLTWMKQQIEADRATRGFEARKLAQMLQAWNALSKPVIARIHGAAFGGGVGLACIADISIASDQARFGLTETRLGLIPATIGPHVLARLGPGARQVFMSSRRFDAADALRLGLIARAVSPEDLDRAVEAEIKPYLAASPGAVATAKAMALRLAAPVTEQMIDQSIADLVDQWETPEALEGITAFLEKRKAAWDLS